MVSSNKVLYYSTCSTNPHMYMCAILPVYRCLSWLLFCNFRYGSVLILGCELYAGDVIIVFLSVINGSFTLGNALPKLEAFATALGSATVVFEIIDRVYSTQ